jgi:DNA adenine methylase
VKTPISYYGGKQRIASKIVQEINKIPHSVYAEPFAGGLAVLYAKGVPAITNSNHYAEAINDTNEQLIAFWRVAREQPEELNRCLQLTPYSQAEHKRAREICKNHSKHTQLDIAWATYIECNLSFAREVGKGWATGTTSRNLAATHRNRLQPLPECFERLRSVHIGCEDALKFIKRWDSPQTLFYCDPPYPGTNLGHYSGYTMEDYQALCDALDNAKGSYILSNYSQDIAPKSAVTCVEIKARMSAANGRTRDSSKTERVEKLWICDRSHNVRDDLKKILTGSNVEQLPLVSAETQPDREPRFPPSPHHVGRSIPGASMVTESFDGSS